MDIITSEMRRILSNHFVSNTIAHALLALGIVTFVYIVYTIIASYINGKRTGKPTSWLKVTDDIRWTLYCWDDRDQQYVMSLPRLIYFISAILIIYVVVANRPEMLTPLLGFNLSAMISYTGKRYIEEKAEEREDLQEATVSFNKDFKKKLDELRNLSCDIPCGSQDDSEDTDIGDGGDEDEVDAGSAKPDDGDL